MALKSFCESRSEKLKSILQRFYPTIVFSTPWPPHIEFFLILLRLFPTKNKALSEVFVKAIEKLIIFKTVRFWH